MPASFWALMLTNPLPPLRPLFIWDLVCPSDYLCVCMSLSLLSFSISPSFSLCLYLYLCLSVSARLSAPSLPQDSQKYLSLPLLKLPPAKTPSTCHLKATWPYSCPLPLCPHRLHRPCRGHRGQGPSREKGPHKHLEMGPPELYVRGQVGGQAER